MLLFAGVWEISAALVCLFPPTQGDEVALVRLLCKKIIKLKLKTNA